MNHGSDLVFLRWQPRIWMEMECIFEARLIGLKIIYFLYINEFLRITSGPFNFTYQIPPPSQCHQCWPLKSTAECNSGVGGCMNHTDVGQSNARDFGRVTVECERFWIWDGRMQNLSDCPPSPIYFAKVSQIPPLP